MPEAPRSVRGLDFAPRGDVFPSPADWRDLVFYQLLVDRLDDNKDHPPYDPATAWRGRDTMAFVGVAPFGNLLAGRW